MTLLNLLFNRRSAHLTSIPRAELENLRGQVSAIARSQAVIEFDLEGNILTANDNFLAAMGYTLEEIQGKHHRMFVDAGQQQSTQYRDFWARLGRGEYDTGQYKRIAKGGKEIWIQASYNPIFDANNRPFKVVKFATDISADIQRNADYSGQLAAISKSQAVIEFSLDGIVLNANDNFLAVLGYSLEEIKGRHHSMFVDPTHRQSHEYKAFWDRLGRGEYDAGNTNGSPKMARKCGFKQVTTRFWMPIIAPVKS